MDLLLVLGGILWVVLSVVNKKKQQEKKQAERESAALGRAAKDTGEASSASAARPESAARPAPAARPVPFQPARSAARPFNPYAPEPEAPATKAPTAAKQQPAVTSAPLVSNMKPQFTEGPTERTAVSLSHNLTEIHATQRHQLTSSYDTGHAHEETSMTGYAEDCPTSFGESSPSRQSAAAPAAFSWNQNAVLSGLIYSEILGKPKALRGR